MRFSIGNRARSLLDRRIAFAAEGKDVQSLFAELVAHDLS